MICLDFMPGDHRCARGIPVSPGFGSFFCRRKHELCPLIIWEKNQSSDANILRPKSFIPIWRKP